MKKIIPLIVLCLGLFFFGFKKNYDTKEHVVVLVKYKTQPSKEKDAINSLTELINKVKKEPHFVKIKLHVDSKDKTNILLYEEWDDETYYNSSHMTTDHLQKFIGDSRNFLSIKKPKLREQLGLFLRNKTQ